MKATIPAPAAILLDAVAKYETRGNYLAYYGHASNAFALPRTVAAVQVWQKTLKVSSATGRYQFMYATLRDLCAEYGIPGSEPFTPDLQDELAFYLLVRRGYDKWVAGEMLDADFADSLSKEWASLPYHTGKSFYDGDGLNHSLLSRAEFIDIVVRAKKAIVTGPAVATAPKPPVVEEKPMVANPFDSAIQTAENFATQIESAIKVVVSPNNNITVSGAPGSPVGGVFSSIGEAQTCISDIYALVQDAKAKNVSGAEHDVINFLENLFTILSNFGVSIPGLTFINSALVALDPVQPAKA